MPPTFSDSELDQVLAAAAPLPIERRDAFVREVTAALAGVELGPGAVHRAVMAVQRRHFDPPLDDIDRRSGKYFRYKAR